MIGTFVAIENPSRNQVKVSGVPVDASSTVYTHRPMDERVPPLVASFRPEPVNTAELIPPVLSISTLYESGVITSGTIAGVPPVVSSFDPDPVNTVLVTCA